MKSYVYGSFALGFFAASAVLVWLTRPLTKKGFVWADLADETWQNDLDTHEDLPPRWETMQAQDCFYDEFDNRRGRR